MILEKMDLSFLKLGSKKGLRKKRIEKVKTQPLTGYQECTRRNESSIKRTVAGGLFIPRKKRSIRRCIKRLSQRLRASTEHSEKTLSHSSASEFSDLQMLSPDDDYDDEVRVELLEMEGGDSHLDKLKQYISSDIISDTQAATVEAQGKARRRITPIKVEEETVSRPRFPFVDDDKKEGGKICLGDPTGYRIVVPTDGFIGNILRSIEKPEAGIVESPLADVDEMEMEDCQECVYKQAVMDWYTHAARYNIITPNQLHQRLFEWVTQALVLHQQRSHDTERIRQLEAENSELKQNLQTQLHTYEDYLETQNNCHGEHLRKLFRYEAQGIPDDEKDQILARQHVEILKLWDEFDNNRKQINFYTTLLQKFVETYNQQKEQLEDACSILEHQVKLLAAFKQQLSMDEQTSTTVSMFDLPTFPSQNGDPWKSANSEEWWNARNSILEALDGASSVLEKKERDLKFDIKSFVSLTTPSQLLRKDASLIVSQLHLYPLPTMQADIPPIRNTITLSTRIGKEEVADILRRELNIKLPSSRVSNIALKKVMKQRASEFWESEFQRKQKEVDEDFMRGLSLEERKRYNEARENEEIFKDPDIIEALRSSASVQNNLLISGQQGGLGERKRKLNSSNKMEFTRPKMVEKGKKKVTFSLG